MLKTKQTGQPALSNFKKGITLQEYLNKVEDIQEQGEQSSQQDLYGGLKVPHYDNIKLTTYAIHQIDEENYHQDQSYQQPEFNVKEQIVNINLINKNLYEKTRPNIRISSIDDKFNKVTLKGIKNTNNSNSPSKGSQSKTQMFRSLYGNSFGGFALRPSQPSIFSSTIHNKFFKVGGNGEVVKKELQFKQKNKKHYSEVMKYQKVVRDKYINKFDILNIRVDGVKDRLCQRKNNHRN